MMDFLFKAQKYMNWEYALTAKGLTGKQKKEETSQMPMARGKIVRITSQKPRPIKVV